MNGVRIDAVDADGFLEAVGSFLSCGRSHTVHFCAAHPTVVARGDPGYRELLNRGDLNLPDGAAVAWAATAQGYRAARLAGSEGMNMVAEWGVPQGLGHFLYGATPATLERLRCNLERVHPGIRIVGMEAPPFRPVSDEELDATLERIRAVEAHAVWIGLGAPKQDIIGARMRDREAAPLLFCVGAAFDFLSGTKRRAPVWMRRSGLEWLHRLLSEPGRLWKRYLIGNARFLAGVAVDHLKSNPGGRRPS